MENVLITPEGFRALLDLFMCSDPYPCEGRECMENFVNHVALMHGYEDWVVAYHEFKPGNHHG